MPKNQRENIERITSLLEKFSNATGISGYEGNVEKMFATEIRPYIDEIKTDRLGNLIAHKKGEGLTIMIAAHMDEIGLIVKYIDEKGFIRFTPVGGFFDQTLLSQRVIIHGKKGPVLGLVGSKPPHVMKDEERKKVVEIKTMFIDIGAKDAKDAEKMGIEVGSTVTLDREFQRLANDNVTGKAFDNRVGLVMLVEAMRRISKLKVKANVFAVGTVQEEVGLKGARTSAYGINPDVAIATDVTIPGDHPGIDKQEAAVEMGKGSVITIMEAGGRGAIVPERIINWLKETGDKNKIKYQVEVSEGGMTDAASIHLIRNGIPTGVISAPARYIHSPVEMVNINDVDSGAELIAQAILLADKYFGK